MKLISTCDNQIANLGNQIKKLMAPFGTSKLSSLPQNIQSQCSQLQIQLLACCKIKLQCCIQLCFTISTCNNTTPTTPGTVPVGTETGQGGTVPTTESVPSTETGQVGSIPTGQTTPNTETGFVPVVENGTVGEAGQAPPATEASHVPKLETENVTTPGQLPTPQQEFKCCFYWVVVCQIQCAQQQSVCQSICSQLSNPITPSQMLSQCQNYQNNLQPQFLAQAQTTCNNQLQNALRKSIPVSLLPQNVYPRALQKAATLRFNLQNALNKLAGQGMNQNTPISSLVPQLQAANNLQNQYQNQKSICLLLKLLIMIEGQIPGLTNQLRGLVPGQSYLYGGNIPQNLRPQVYGLQKQIGGLLKLQQQTSVQLANAFAPSFNPTTLESAPGSPAYSACVNYICILKCQYEALAPGLANLANQMGQPSGLANIESQCNEAAANLKPNLYGQAQKIVYPLIENRFNKLAGPSAGSVSPLNMKLALQLILLFNIQNELTGAQNAANALKNQPSQLQTYNKLNNIANQIQNRLNNENQIGNMYRALINIQNMMNQLQPQVSNQPSNLNYLTPANFQNQAKLAYLANLQYLCNVNIANNLQQGIQALTTCANEYGNLANSAPNALQSRPYTLQNQAARNALSQCQNQYQALAGQQIPQAQNFYNTLQSNCNNLKNAMQGKGINNLAALENQAQEQCKSALAVIIDITAIVETNVHTTTNIHTSGQPGNGEAQVETKVGQNVQTSQPVQQSLVGGSFLSMNSRKK